MRDTTEIRIKDTNIKLKEINTNNVKKMADIIINEAIDNGYGVLKDDMTVIVAKVNKI